MKNWILIMLCCAVTAFGQNRNQGLIIPPPDVSAYGELCCLYFPDATLDLYNAPGSEIVAKLSRKKDENGKPDPNSLLLQDINGQNAETLDYTYLDEINGEIAGIFYTERSNGFIRIFGNKGNYWLKITDIESTGFRVMGWQEHMSEVAGQVLGYYANEPGLNLRTSPSAGAAKILTLKGDLFEITPTKEHKGNWTRVKIKKYKQHPCEGLSEEENLEYEKEGWVKIVDDSGSPNVFNYTRGC